MSRTKTIRSKVPLDLSTERLHRLQHRAQEGVTLVTERVGPTAQQARDMAADRILQAREWSAPRLDQAAKFVEAELGPRVSAFLSETARKVEPPKSSHRSRGAAALIGAAGAGAAGVAGALAMRRKNMHESEKAENTEDSGISPAEADAAPAPAASATDKAGNGQQPSP